MAVIMSPGLIEEGGILPGQTDLSSFWLIDQTESAWLICLHLEMFPPTGLLSSLP